jgi:hypothetical protein
MRHTIFVFGEAEKGQFCTPILCHSLLELSNTFGNPTAESLGIFYAIQALLYERELIYFRVEEEGFSIWDYKRGLHILRNRDIPQNPTAICLPGVGNADILNEISELCYIFHSLVITTEKDFYDYITQ